MHRRLVERAPDPDREMREFPEEQDRIIRTYLRVATRRAEGG